MKKVYTESVKKWGAGGVSIGTLVGLIFLYLSLSGAITITGYSGDQVCAGTLEDPCYAYINFTAEEDIFLYPTGYDPWGRNTTFAFSPGVKSWKLERSWGNGWREIDLNDTCKGTWCGAPYGEKSAAYSYAFREGRDYQMRITAYKNEPWEDVKWSVDYNSKEYLDPAWISPYKSKYTETTETHCLKEKCKTTFYSGTRFVQEDNQWKKIEEARSLKNSNFKLKFLENDSNYNIKVIDFNYSSITVELESKVEGNIPIRIWQKEEPEETQIKKQTQKEIYKGFNKTIEQTENFYFLKKKVTKTYPMRIGDLIEFGPNSSTAILSEPDTQNLEDTGLEEQYPDINSGSDGNFKLHNYSGYNDWGLIKFAAEMPASYSAINSATFSWHISSNRLDADSEGFNVSVYQHNNQTWSEDYPTWNNFGDLGSYNTTVLANTKIYGGAGEPSGYQDIDVTNEFIQRLNNNENITFFFKAHDQFGSPSSSDCIYVSTKEDASADEHPKITVDYDAYLNIVTPTDDEIIVDGPVGFNVSATESMDFCYYQLDGTNLTMSSVNSTYFTASNSSIQGGNYDVRYWCNRTSNGEWVNTEEVHFYVDAVNLTGCTILNTSNRVYEVQNDISFSDGEYCFDVRQNNITIDGNDYLMTGDDSTSLSAVYVDFQTYPTADNVTVHNLKAKNATYAVYLYGANGQIYNNEFTDIKKPIANFGYSSYVAEEVNVSNNIFNYTGDGSACSNIWYLEGLAAGATYDAAYNKVYNCVGTSSANIVYHPTSNDGNVKIHHNEIYGGDTFIYNSYGADNNEYYSNYIQGCDTFLYYWTDDGYYSASTGNKVYNNYINCTTLIDEDYDRGHTTILNTTNQSGTRPDHPGDEPSLIGGNYWINSTDDLSGDCTDSDADGFCDSSISILTGTDYLPYSDEYSAGAPDINYSVALPSGVIRFENCSPDWENADSRPIGQTSDIAAINATNNGTVAGDFLINLTGALNTGWTLFASNDNLINNITLNTTAQTIWSSVGAGETKEIWLKANCSYVSANPGQSISLWVQ